MQQDWSTLGVLHPGQMGASVGAAARAAAARVLWVSEGRSDATRARAEASGLEDAVWLNGLVNRSDVIVSVCPPHAAEAVAREVAGLGYRGIYVDANAVSPQTARRVAGVVEEAGATAVDGGIIGPPAARPGTTRLYLSGSAVAVERVRWHFEGGPLDARALDGPVGAASALKMAYAAYTKGTTALLAAIHALAEHEDVHEALLEEWALSQPDLLATSERRTATGAARAWRFAGEMDEIAATFGAAGLPDGFHRAAAEVYRRLERFRDDPEAPGGAALARYLLKRDGHENGD